MKRTLLTLACIFSLILVNGQDMKTIKLNAPDKSKGKSVMNALADRHSTREFSGKELSLQELSDLLWAANGFNRTDRRTAASAMNAQEIDIYVCMKDGAYLYDAKENRLTQITTEDLRPGVDGGQGFAQVAPVCLVLVADMSKPRNDSDGTRLMSAYDAGIVSGNIYLYCSAMDLATVCRAGMDKEKLKAGLKLSDNQIIHLNHPVGYHK